MRISDWSSDVCSSDLERRAELLITEARLEGRQERIVDLEIAIDPPGVGIARVVILTARQRADIVIVDIGQIDTVDQRRGHLAARVDRQPRSEEHTSELQSLMRNSYAVFCLKKKNN